MTASFIATSRTIRFSGGVSTVTWITRGIATGGFSFRSWRGLFRAARMRGSIGRISFIVVAFCALGVYWTSCWLLLSGCPPWWGAVVDRLVLDGPLCALFAGYLYYSRIGRWKVVYLLALLVPLLRETGILIMAGILAAAALQELWKRVLVFATVAIPVVLWWCFVMWHTSPSTALSIFQRPVIGLVLSLFTFTPDHPGLSERGIILARTIDFLAMAGYILCLALAAKWLWIRRRDWRDPVNFTVAGFLLLGLALGQEAHLLSAYGYARPLSPLILWVVLQALASRQWVALIPPLLVSGSVGIDLASFTWQAMRALFRF
jgi:hypothetical protein